MTKKPLKEDHTLKEREKVESEVFDKETLKSLSKIIKKGIIKSIDFPISTGKEANVFRATTPSGSYVAIKIYKIETTPFFRREEYMNLEICEDAGVHAPKPLYVENNVLVLTFIGEEGLPYQTMNLIGPR